MKLTLLILGSLFSAGVSAGIYKCTDANGNTEYRSSPCQTGHENVEINIKTGTAIDLDEQSKQQRSLQNGQRAAEEKQRLEQEQLLRNQAKVNKGAVIESAKNQFLIKNNPDKYSAYAIPPYAPDKLPDLVKPFQSRLAEIEQLRRLAAEKALASNQCARVESVELNAKSTKTTFVFLINCSSGKFFYFNEQELTDKNQ